jgi:peroxiredoxin
MPGAPRIIGVSQDDAAKTQVFAEKYAPSVTMLLDEGRLGYPASNAFGITHVPTVFVTEVDGEISAAWTGFSKADMEALAQRTGIPVFGPHDSVPVWKAG